MNITKHTKFTLYTHTHTSFLMVFFGIVVVSNFVFVRNLGDGEGVVCVCGIGVWPVGDGNGLWV
jgi:hypothetical protein